MRLAKGVVGNALQRSKIIVQGLISVFFHIPELYLHFTADKHLRILNDEIRLLQDKLRTF